MKTRILSCLVIFIAFTLTGGCTSASTTPTTMPTSPPATIIPTALPANPPRPIILQYIGHSCTLITAPDGTRIISDPYKDHPLGLALFPDDLTADLVTVSHFHPDHVATVKGNPKIIFDPGSFQVGMVEITGYKGDHGLVNGKSSGENTVFVFEIGGVKIVHLGAAGVVTQGDILAAMENADVVIVDIMGDAAHPLKDELNQLLERNVRTIIPTHYSFEGQPRYYGSATLQEFLQIVPPTLAIVRQESTLQIAANMPKQLAILTPGANENEPATKPTNTSATGQPSASPIVAPTERVKIRWFIGVGTGRTPDAVETARQFVEKFNNSQDKIELSLEVVTSSTHDAIDKLKAEIEAGNPPDIVTPANIGWSGEQLDSYILPLDDLVTGYDLSSIDPKELDYWRVQGKLIGLPLGSFTSVIFYNKYLFAAANLPDPPHKFGEPYADGEPWTVEKMEKIARQLTLDAFGRNATDPNFEPARVTQWGFHWQWDSTRSMAVMFGPGSVVDRNGKAVIPPQWREGFNWFYDGIWKKSFIPSTAQVNAVMRGNPFASGEVAMVNYFTFLSPRLIGIKGWDLAAVPSYKGLITSRLEYDGTIILNTTRHPAEAVKVAYAIANNPELLLVWDMLPSFKGMQATFIEQLMVKHPGVDWQVMLDSRNYANTTYEDDMPNYRKSYDRLLEFRDLMGMYENLSLDAEINKLESDLQILFQEAQ